ncbi:STAS domain-containing protein [Phosphitispora fastidiosa]|uniref:STAS domain-containing protein n=1 Tax=Phosphitispora fastidiosa TaxID=2837202 RepID=UPI001E2DC3CF|nr:anti-sigma factor antagonist [Phosphitispora fastidiosa]MBU7007708.1 stage II sporulation protein AA (anti-sigma F factor antagonist) [Phosphitispora fastidiosa]
MNIESVANRKTLILRVSGELDMLVADDFRRKTDALMENHCSRNLVLNLAGVNFIDSSGLGAILGRYKNITMGGGKVALVGAPPQVRRILELSGILRITSEFETENDALEAM